jgi:hypothetical protein
MFGPRRPAGKASAGYFSRELDLEGRLRAIVPIVRFSFPIRQTLS